MIVISTNNGWEYIEKCVDSYISNDIKDLLIVDTKSSDDNFVGFSKHLCEVAGIKWTQTENANYDFGAYVHAYRNYKSDWYFFSHDSIYLKDKTSIEWIKKYIDDKVVCAWNRFYVELCPFIPKEQRTWCIDNFGSDKYEWGIFGPAFGISREYMELLDSKGYFNVVVDTKWKQEGMERGWPIIFNLESIPYTSLETILGGNYIGKHDEFFDNFKNSIYRYFHKDSFDVGKRD
jgi:hypothetical protein